MITGKSKIGSKGFTLVEVIISIAILAIITVPLLGYFVDSTKYNTKAKVKQNAVTLAQSIMEQCKDKSLEEIAAEFHTLTDRDQFIAKFNLVDPLSITNPTDSTRPDMMVEEVKNVSGTAIGAKGGSGCYASGSFNWKLTPDNAGILYFKIGNIHTNEGNYDALLRFDTNSYATENDKTLYDISAIREPENVTAVESVQYERICARIYGMYTDEYSQEIAANVSPEPVQLTEDNIRNSIRRIMVMKVSPISGDSTKAQLRVYYQYYCEGSIIGCPTEASPLECDAYLYDEEVFRTELKNIYLFFQQCNSQYNVADPEKETVQILCDTSLTTWLQGINVYLLCQANASGQIPTYDVTVDLSSGPSSFHTIYTNARYVKDKNDFELSHQGVDNYVTKTPKLRMLKVQIDIYKTGELNNNDFLYATLDSAKGE